MRPDPGLTPCGASFPFYNTGVFCKKAGIHATLHGVPFFLRIWSHERRRIWRMNDSEMEQVFRRRVVAIIVNYNTWSYTLSAIRSLAPAASRFADLTVHVVDNKSPGNDAAELAAAIAANGWEKWVFLHAEDANLGFAAGNNVVVRQMLQPGNAGEARPDHFYLLNPDAYVKDDAVEQMVLFLERNAEVGIVGSGLEHESGGIATSAFRFPTLLGEFEQALGLGLASRLLARWRIAPPPRAATYRTDWVGGASVMIRRQVFDDIGLMDAGYFLYFEETDFMLRAAQAGWQAWYLHTARAVHLIGKSTKMREGEAVDEKPLPAYLFESWRRYYTKNYGTAYAIATGVAVLSGAMLYRLHRRLLNKRREQAPNIISAMWRYYLRPLLWRRSNVQ